MNDCRKFVLGYGFTLAEVLIALALLGLIAAFTIPQLLTTIGVTHKQAIWKETFSTLNDAAAENRLQGRFLNQPGEYASIVQYFFNKTNTLKTCPTSLVDEGCWPAGITYGTNAAYDEEHASGMVLPNGAVISFWPDVFYLPDRSPNGVIGAFGEFGHVFVISIDWNGPSGNNRYTTEQMDGDVIQTYMGVTPGGPWTYGIVIPIDPRYTAFLKS